MCRLLNEPLALVIVSRWVVLGRSSARDYGSEGVTWLKQHLPPLALSYWRHHGPVCIAADKRTGGNAATLSNCQSPGGYGGFDRTRRRERATGWLSVPPPSRMRPVSRRKSRGIAANRCNSNPQVGARVAADAANQLRAVGCVRNAEVGGSNPLASTHSVAGQSWTRPPSGDEITVFGVVVDEVGDEPALRVDGQASRSHVVQRPLDELGPQSAPAERRRCLRVEEHGAFPVEPIVGDAREITVDVELVAATRFVVNCLRRVGHRHEC